MRHLILFSIFLFIAAGGVFAQTTTERSSNDFVPSPDTATVRYIHIDKMWPENKVYYIVDSVLTGFQVYDPIESTGQINAVNGNIGLAYEPLIFNFKPDNSFRFTPYNFDLYRLTNQNIRYYQTFGPFTNVFYSFGRNKQQLFNLTHTQNIARGLSLGMDLNIINSLGLYNRQKSDNVSVAAQLQFVTNNERYVVLSNYHNNRFRWRENGGIAYDSLFTQNIETDRKRIGIRLQSADNQTKENSAFIRQYYYFGKNTRLPHDKSTHKMGKQIDSLAMDTTNTTLPNRLFFNPQRSDFFRHTFSFSQNSWLYTDDNPAKGYYSNIYRDSIVTYDSLSYYEIRNDFTFEGGIGRARGSEKALLLRAGIEHSYTVYRNDTVTRKYNRVTPYGYLAANAFGVARAEGYLWFTNGAPFNGDKGISTMLTLPAFDNSTSWGNLSASLSLHSLQPDYIFQSYASNHFQWDNTFGQQTILSGKINYKRNNLSAGFNFYNIEGWVYFNEESLPQRENASFRVNQLYGLAEFPLGHFNIEAFGTWQNVSNKTVLRLPELAGRLSAYYKIALFKRALHLQTGLTLTYNTAFYANAYMPALRSYYLQNSYKTGNYPYLDGFINLRVKRARLFFVFEHLNSGFSGYSYMMVPSYPMPDRGFRFGVSWMFYD